jgi:putative FmdB family regulatory protein
MAYIFLLWNYQPGGAFWLPIYEYSCPKCGVFERIQRISDPALETCPHCGGQVKRLIGRNVGIVFKSGGFYASDHRSESYKQKEKEDSSRSPSLPGLDKAASSSTGESITSTAKKDAAG